MKRLKNLTVMLLAVVAGNFPARADSLPATTNPPVPATNHLAEIAAARTNLPIITPNGVMTLFGKKQALFKVTSSDPAAAENSFFLSEGERRDGIKVVAIDPETDAVTFDNHGVVQKISIKSAAPAIAPVAMQQPQAAVISQGSVVPSRFTPRDFAGGVVVADFVRHGSPAVGFKRLNRFRGANPADESAGDFFLPPPGFFPGQPAVQPNPVPSAPIPVVQNVLRYQPIQYPPPMYQAPNFPNYPPPQGYNGGGASVYQMAPLDSFRR